MNKVTLFLIPFFAVVALLIALSVPEWSIIPDGLFYGWIKATLTRYDSFERSFEFFSTLAIPQIPMIDNSVFGGGFGWDMLANFVNFLSTFVNGITAFINFLIAIVGVLWRVISFCIASLMAIYDLVSFAIQSFPPASVAMPLV